MYSQTDLSPSQVDALQGVETKVKQVIVIRRDLKMRRGKEIAQGSHGSIAFLTERMRKGWKSKSAAKIKRPYTVNAVQLSQAEWDWINDRFTKVCCRVDSEEELLALDKAAKEAGLESHLIQDSGLTEFHGVPTYTVLAIGPDYPENIDPVTGNLELY